MRSTSEHRGIAEDDPRNTGPIDYFRPMEVTRASATATLAPYYLKKGIAELEAKVDALMARIENGPIRPAPPISQPLEAIVDLRLGTHPDIVERLWKLDGELPHSCRWVFWGRPALVHPRTGIVFAIGYGSIGVVMRLPPGILESAEPDQALINLANNPGRAFDFSTIGPEWRLLSWTAPGKVWVRGAYEFAGFIAQ